MSPFLLLFKISLLTVDFSHVTDYDVFVWEVLCMFCFCFEMVSCVGQAGLNLTSLGARVTNAHHYARFFGVSLFKSWFQLSFLGL